MTIFKFANNFSTTLATTISNSITTIVLTSATGLPSIGANEVYSLTINDGTNIEEMIVTDDSSSPSLIVTRNADGRGAYGFTAGSIIEMRPTSTQQSNMIQSVNNVQGQDITLEPSDIIDGASIATTTVATNDKVILQDTSDSNNVKTVTTQAIADLKTTIIGITGTKSQFNTACSDGDFLYSGDVTQYTDEMAQDAIGGMVDSTLVYIDGTPLLQRAALTGDVTASAGSNATIIATPSSATVDTDDKVLIKDTSASDTTKYVTALSIRDLTPTAGTTGSGKEVNDNTPTLITPNIIGTTTNDSAAAGSVGEFISASLGSGSAISLTTVTAADITSISLTAGDWDISWVLAFQTASTTSLTDVRGASNTVSATFPGFGGTAHPYTIIQFNSYVPGVTTFGFGGGTQGRISLSATTTVYLVARGTFSVSTLKAYGSIWARRVR